MRRRRSTSFYNRDTTDVEYLSAYTAPGSQVEYWDIAHVLTDENRITPHPVADKYEVAALTAAGGFEDTSILLPEIGWIDLVGFVAATGRFALHIPVSFIRGLSTAAAMRYDSICGDILGALRDGKWDRQRWCISAIRLDGNLLISSNAGGRGRSVCVQLRGRGMMELQWGVPIQGGETAPGGLPVWLYKVSADGTRRIEPHSLDAYNTGDMGTRAFTSAYGRADAHRICRLYPLHEPWRHARDRGLSFLKTRRSPQRKASAGAYVHFVDNPGDNRCRDRLRPPRHPDARHIHTILRCAASSANTRSAIWTRIRLRPCGCPIPDQHPHSHRRL